MRNIHPRMHCIPCYDFLCRVRRIASIPQELEQLEEETAIGVVTKAYEVANSDFYVSLPDNIKIQSGANSNYNFDKSAEKAEIIQIMNEITGVAV